MNSPLSGVVGCLWMLCGGEVVGCSWWKCVIEVCAYG